VHHEGDVRLSAKRAGASSRWEAVKDHDPSSGLGREMFSFVGPFRFRQQQFAVEAL